MFESARLKLTAWYLLIIMLISIFFSVAFFDTSTREIERIIHRMEQRQQRLKDFFPLLPQPPDPNVAELEESVLRLKILLILINAGIFLLAGGAGYFLAGRTLKPIKQMVDEQNRFITDASHELRTPLTALRSELEASLLDKQLGIKQAQKIMSSNLEEVVHLQDLSDNLLQLTRQNSQPKKVFQDVSILQAIEDSLKKTIPLAKKKHIAINNDVNDSLIKGNPTTLSQLFTILIDNAIKYSPPKTQIVIRSVKKDHTILISITDKGFGIDKKDLPYIFERFYRADKSRTKTEVSGSGLGLSIAKQIVEDYSGAISAKSVIAKGTTFIVALPI